MLNGIYFNHFDCWMAFIWNSIIWYLIVWRLFEITQKSIIWFLVIWLLFYSYLKIVEAAIFFNIILLLFDYYFNFLKLHGLIPYHHRDHELIWNRFLVLGNQNNFWKRFIPGYHTRTFFWEKKGISLCIPSATPWGLPLGSFILACGCLTVALDPSGHTTLRAVTQDLSMPILSWGKFSAQTGLPGAASHCLGDCYTDVYSKRLLQKKIEGFDAKSMAKQLRQCFVLQLVGQQEQTQVFPSLQQ